MCQSYFLLTFLLKGKATEGSRRGRQGLVEKEKRGHGDKAEGKRAGKIEKDTVTKRREIQ